MLSIENPPPDLSCSYQFTHLNSSSDERASSKLPLPAERDLPNQTLDRHNPLPNFSIRDYVFKARSKDIKKNWPFSLKNLQLCWKHGVKELLPPFQPLETESKQSCKRCTDDSSSIENGKSSNFDKKPSRLDSHAVLDLPDDRLNYKLAESCTDISSCRSGDENDFPSTTTSVSLSEIESLSVSGQSSSQTKSYLKSSVAVEASGPSGNNKTEGTFRPLSKKCRLIVKFGATSDRSSTEDIASNCTSISETMASKVCPVCKTFSSTSNTTLNAHIDQCLSVESLPKWTADSKLTRHRIKPRKTRLMVDIYCTALPCTLEELDRRNGTSWAAVSCLPMQETDRTETTDKGKKTRMSPVHPEDVSDVGPVYIDANGTKLRILSKFDDRPPVSKVGEDIEIRKSLKIDKGSKYISKKKKKSLVHKHRKYRKISPQSKTNFSLKAYGSQISGGEEECQGEATIWERENLMSKQTKPSDCGTIRPWVCSKRRDQVKKIANQEGHQSMRCNWQLTRDLLAENGQSILGVSSVERNLVRKFPNLPENLISSAGNNKRVEKSCHKIQASKRREQSPARKRVGNLLAEVRTSDDTESSLPLKQNTIRLGNFDTTMPDCCVLRYPNSGWNHSSLLRKRRFNACRAAIDNSKMSWIASKKSSRDAEILSKAMEFSSSRKKLFSRNCRSSVVPDQDKKLSALKSSQGRFMKKRDKEVITCQSGVDQQYDIMHLNVENQDNREKTIADESLRTSTVLETREARDLLSSSQGEKKSALLTSKPVPPFNDHDMLINADSSVKVGDDFPQKVDCLESAGNQAHISVEDIVVESCSNAYDGRNAISVVKPVDPGFYEFGDSLKLQSNSLRSVEGYRGFLCGNEATQVPSEHEFVNDQEMFSVNEIGRDLMGKSSYMGLEKDLEADCGKSFPEVDPIPIPGPPGSFLPSPRDMGSEDFQGNSSLTTSRVHSSPDQLDMVNGNSSDSSVSAFSTVSNSIVNKCDFKYSEPSLSVEPYNKIRSMAANVESSQKGVDAVLQVSGSELERTAFEGEYLKLDRIYAEKGSLNFKNDQPCCCQRKERLSQDTALNFQESQLRRWKMASLAIPAGGKQMGFNSSLRPADLDVRPVSAPPGSCPDPGSEKVVLPVVKPLSGPFCLKESPRAGVRFSTQADSDSASPSASNPVLRLMGKNLLVVSKDDKTSISLGGAQTCIQNNPQSSQFLAFSTVSSRNIQNPDYHPIKHIGLKASTVFGQSSHKSVFQYHDGGLSNSFRSQSDPRLHVQARLPAGMFQGLHTDCSLARSRECHEFKDDFNISSWQNCLKTRLNISSADNMGRVAATSDHLQHADSPLNPVKEIIIIDDVPESENIVISNVTQYAEGGRERQVVSSGVAIPAASNCNPHKMHPSSYQSQDHPPLESTSVRNATIHTNPSKLGNKGPVRWGCTLEGSGVFQRSPLSAASSSPCQPRSTVLNHSLGFS